MSPFTGAKSSTQNGEELSQLKWVALKMGGGTPVKRAERPRYRQLGLERAAKPRGSAEHSVPEGQCRAQGLREAVQSAVPQKASAEYSSKER